MTAVLVSTPPTRESALPLFTFPPLTVTTPTTALEPLLAPIACARKANVPLGVANAAAFCLTAWPCAFANVSASIM